MASALDYCPSIYADCATADIPDLVQGNCVQAGVDLIDAVLITPADAPGFTDAEYASVSSLAAAITARLKQTGQITTVAGYSANAAIRKWNTFDAQKPFAEPTLVTVRPGVQIPKKTPKAIEGADYDNSLANHNWHIQMNCYRNIRMWYLAGQYLYGGKQGIISAFNSWHGIIDSGDRPAEGFIWRLGYAALRTEDKCLRPGVV